MPDLDGLMERASGICSGYLQRSSCATLECFLAISGFRKRGVPTFQILTLGFGITALLR